MLAPFNLGRSVSTRSPYHGRLRHHCDEPDTIFDHLPVIRLHVLRLRSADRYSYRLPGLYLWPHGFVDATKQFEEE